MLQQEGEQQRHHSLTICPPCTRFDWDESDCTGRIKTCGGPYGRNWGVQEARKLAEEFRRGEVELIGGWAVE